MTNTAQQISNEPQSTLPPMLQQYLEYKRQYSDALLFFQVGDFYELFFEDAVTTAKALNLTLTSRDKNNPNPVPMCGVPIAVIDNYAERLVDQGFSAAIVSQSVSFSDKGKQLVNRELERIITPGIRILGNVSNDSAQGLLAAVSFASDGRYSLAQSDVNSGIVIVREDLDQNRLFLELQRLNLAELILPNSHEQKKIDKRSSIVVTLGQLLPGVSIKFRASELASLSGLTSRNLTSIPGYSSRGEEGRAAVRLLLRYLDEVTVSSALPIREILESRANDLMHIDAMTRTNLELVRSVRGAKRDGSLISVIDRTVSPGGSRLLHKWLLEPSIKIDEINSRLDAVETLVAKHTQRKTLQAAMRFAPDLERIATRLEMLVVLPRELAALRDILNQVPKIKSELSDLTNIKAISEIIEHLNYDQELLDLLTSQIVDSPEPSLAQGGVIRDGFDSELDELRNIRQKGNAWISELESKEKERTGIGSLKIKYNGVIGFFIEITAANKDKIPSDYIRRQSTANTERFTTNELKLREKDVLTAESRQIAREKVLYEQLKKLLKKHVVDIRKTAAVLAKLDLFCGFAELSESQAFVRPVVDNSQSLKIEAGKHPVLMTILGPQFIPNSLELNSSSSRFLIITGPNMGGKSTYLRQAALIVIMAQMGCFVPAESAQIGVIDRIFARLGASDNQAEGESTFMVEMKEAAQIIAQATSRSLVLVDEIGRGTATADGVAIAQAIVEWLVSKNKCRVVFATHFHELTALTEQFPSIKNCSVASFENDGQVVFTHEIKEGPASRSYGIDVAKLAGLPTDLLTRAKQLILESTKVAIQRLSDRRQLSIFDTQAATISQEKAKFENRLEKIKDKIEQVDVNATTPMQALAVLEELKKYLNANEDA